MYKQKPRKPRGRKKNGEQSYDMCPGCYMPFCDPFGGSEKYRDEIYRRLRASVCPACGHNPCSCKSKLGLKRPVMKKKYRPAKRRRT